MRTSKCHRNTTQQTDVTIMKNHDWSCFRLQWDVLNFTSCVPAQDTYLKTSFTCGFLQSRERHVAKWCRCLLQALNWVSLLFRSLIKVRAEFRTVQNTEICQFNEIQQLAYRKWVQLASTLGSWSPRRLAVVCKSVNSAAHFMCRVQRGQSVIQQVTEYMLHDKHDWVIVSY